VLPLFLCACSPCQPMLVTQLWLSSLSQKWKKSASSPTPIDSILPENHYHPQHPLQIWIFIPLILFLIQKGKNTPTNCKSCLAVFQCRTECHTLLSHRIIDVGRSSTDWLANHWDPRWVTHRTEQEGTPEAITGLSHWGSSTPSH
jgi:hypothetical protein